MIKSTGDKKIVSEINITPLVDTLLVLLIIFIVTAPAMTRSVGIDLPVPKHGAKAKAETSPSQKKPNFVMNFDRNESVIEKTRKILKNNI